MTDHITPDFNHTHVLNPLWPPHAKFHNGQTMSLSILLSSTSLYLLFRQPATWSIAQQVDNLFLAGWVGSFYLAAGLSAILYPGTAWLDPEFRKVKDVDEPAQLWVFGGALVVLWLGWALERRRVGGQDEGRKRV